MCVFISSKSLDLVLVLVLVLVSDLLQGEVN